MKQTLTKALLFLVMALLSVGAHVRTLIAVVADEDYPPFYYFDEEQQRWAGVSIEVCEAAAASLGYELEYQRYPFNRMLQFVSSGCADIACTLFNTPVRAPGVNYTSVPHAFEDIWAFGRASDPDRRELDVEQLRFHTVGGVRAYFYGQTLEDGEDFKKFLLGNETQLIRVLLAGRVDYGLGNKASITMLAKQLGAADKIRFMEKSVYRGPIYIAVSRAREDSERLVSDLTRAVVAFRETEAYRQILADHGQELPEF